MSHIFGTLHNFSSWKVLQLHLRPIKAFDAFAHIAVPLVTGPTNRAPTSCFEINLEVHHMTSMRSLRGLSGAQATRAPLAHKLGAPARPALRRCRVACAAQMPGSNAPTRREALALALGLAVATSSAGDHVG